MSEAAGARRHVIFKGPVEKAKWLDAGASEDATEPELRRWAAHRFLYDARSQLFGLDRIAHAVHRFVRDRIAYVHDWGGKEEFADSRTILARAYDDCDGKARLFVAIIRALGIPELQARIRPVFKGRDFVHVQAEVKFPGSEHDPRSFDGGWLLAELIVEGVELGDDPKKGRDASGHYVMAGPPPPSRAELVAEHADVKRRR